MESAKDLMKKEKILLGILGVFVVLFIAGSVNAVPITINAGAQWEGVWDDGLGYSGVEHGPSEQVVPVEGGTTASGGYVIWGNLVFDTSGLADDLTIANAKLKVYAVNSGGTEGNVPLEVYWYSSPNTFADLGLLDQLINSPSNLGASISKSLWVHDSYIEIPLSNLNNINKQGNTYLSVYSYSRTPQSKYYFSSPSNTDASKRPALIINDIVPSACVDGKWEYNVTAANGIATGSDVNCQTSANPGANWEFVKRSCLLTPIAGNPICYSDICLWRKVSSTYKEYTTTGMEYGTGRCDVNDNPGNGFTLKKRIISDPVGTYLGNDFCLWEKSGSEGLQYTITHYGTGNGEDVYCNVPYTGTTWSAEPIPTGYSFVTRECIFRNQFPCSSDICLWKNTCPSSPPPQTDPTRCWDASQVMFRMSAETNAQAEVYNGAGNYPIEVCYDKLFLTNYTGANPHQCTASNKVLRLSADTNAHVEAPSLSNPAYASSACYGNLVCEVASSCAQGYTAIASLSAQTNAQVGISSAYSLKLCCSNGGVAGEEVIYDGHWENFRIPSERITQAYKNHTVKLVASTTLQDGTLASFEIYENKLLGVRSVRTGANNISAIVANGKIIANWKILESDLTGIDPDEFGDFYFIAKIGNIQNVSSEIKIWNKIVNNPPIADITGPVHRGIYYVNVPINFTHQSFDADGPLASVEWNVNDASFDSTNQRFSDNFTHSYATTGMKVVNLTVTDQNGAKAVDEIAILIVGVNEALAFIERPKYDEAIISLTGEARVEFSGQDSFVVNSIVGTGCAVTVSCLAGNCPATTESSPDCAVDKSVKIPLTGEINKGFLDLFFNWTFDDGETRAGMGIPSGSKVYGLFEDNRIIKIFTRYNLSANQANAEFTRRFRMYANGCSADGQTYVEVDNQGRINATYKTTNPGAVPGACTGPDKLIGGGDDCCPGGYACTQTGVGPVCISTSVDECADYTTQTTCNEDDSQAFRAMTRRVPRHPVLDALHCGETINNQLTQCTGCLWKPSTSECGINTTVINCPENNCGGGGGGDDVKSCLWTYSSTEIGGGYCQYNLTATPWPPGSSRGADCQSRTETYACQHELVELPFFGVWQFVVSGIGIALIYLVIVKRLKLRNK